MKRKLAFLVAIVCLCATFLFSGGKAVYAEESVNKGLYYFNTESIVFLQGKNAEKAYQEIDEEFALIDKTFSLNLDSEIKKLNKQGYLQNASDSVVYLLNKAKEIYLLTDGAYNPATYLLTDLWQLSSRFSDTSDLSTRPYDRPLYTLPEQKYIDAFKQLLNFEDVVVDGNNISLPSNSVVVDGVSYTMQIDLGGIVKGYAAQRAKEIAKANGITQGYVSLGGSSITFFENVNSTDGKFPVGVLDPDNVNGYYAKTYVKNIGMSTSGDYQPGKYFELDGKKYCHIIDGKTGAPVDTGIRTVSILCNDEILADALTTAVMVKGFEDAKSFIFSEYLSDNNIITSFIYEKQWLFGSVYEMICNTSKDFYNVSDPDVVVCGYVQDGVFVYKPTQSNLYFALTIIAVVVVGGIIFTVAKNRKKAKPNFKKQRFFKPLDVALYGGVLVAVVALFLSFVVFRPQVDLKLVNVYYQNNLVYQFDCEANKGDVVNQNFKNIVEISNQNGKVVVTIEDGKHKNVMEITSKGAKMVEANCSNTKECVNTFAPIQNANQTIICNVSHVKIVGVGEGENLILNG